MQCTYPGLLVGNKKLKDLGGAQEKEKKNPYHFWKRACALTRWAWLIGVVFVCFAYVLLNEMK